MLWDTSRWEDDMVEEDKRHPFAWSPGPRVREVGVVPPHIRMDLNDPFAYWRRLLAVIEDQIAQVYSRLDGVLPPLIERGEYDKADYYRARELERVRELECEWHEWRQLMPPFTTYRDGVYYRHPVTDENRHLLSPLSRVGIFRES